MKRRVRIYKAGGENGSYINKTSRYFQEGGMQMQQEEVTPEQQPTQEPSDEQVITFIMQTLSQPNGSIEQAKEQLVKANINPTRITELSDVALDYINEQQDTQQAAETDNEEEATEMQTEQDAREEAMAEEQAAQQAAQYQDMYAQSEESAVDPNENDDNSAAYMRNGGMLNKKAYISNFMKLAKKQEGGDTEEKKSDVKTDIPIGGREERVSKFHNALKSTANTAALKQQAEDQYKQQMEQMQQMPPQGYAQDGGDTESGVSNFDPYHNLAHYSDSFEHSMPFNELTQAQFGGWGHGKERRAARRMNRMNSPFMQNQMANLSQFMPGQGNLGLANIDVHRTGLFGRPKEYTINFNTVNPITQKDIEDTKKQVIVNETETIKEVDEEVKANTTNTSTDKNTEVKKEEFILPNIEDITVVTDKVKRNSGRNVSGGTSSKMNVAPVTNQGYASQIPAAGSLDFRNKNDITNASDLLLQNLKKAEQAAKNAKWQQHLRQEKINNLPWHEKQMWYVQHPEDKPKVTPGKKTNTSSVNKHITTPSKINIERGPKYQEGGFTDQESGLYKFMGGGEDMDQADLDYSNSKNISSPYFEDGGYFQTAGQTDNSPVEILDENGKVVRKSTLAEAERAGLNHRVLPNAPVKTTKQTTQKQTQQSSTPINNPNNRFDPRMFLPGRAITRGNPYVQQRGNAYMTGTNNPYMGQLGPNAQISSIDVTKSRMFGRGPKEFTINYNVPGQSGIHAPSTAKSYKGSDGQMHWMGSEESVNEKNPKLENNEDGSGWGYRKDGRERRAHGLYRRLTEKGFSTPEETTSDGLHGKDDEAYKEHFGYYPGENPDAANTMEELNNQMRFTSPDQSQMENETYSPIPNFSEMENASLATRNLSPLAQFTESQEPITMQSRPVNNNQFDQEAIPLEPGQEGPQSEEDFAFEQQRQQDLSGYNEGLLGVPTEQDLYQQSQADQFAQEDQDFELQRLYDQSQAYPELGDLESLDYTQQVGPQVSQEQVNRPVTQQRRNTQPNVRQKVNTNNTNNRNTVNAPSNNKVNSKVNDTNWSDSTIRNMNRQQKVDFQNKEGASFNKLKDLKENIIGSNANEFRKSAQKIDTAGKKIFNRLTPTQKLDYLNKLKKVDRNLYEGYVSLLQEGGTAIPRAEFGTQQDSQQQNPFTGVGTGDIPIGYFKDLKTGVIRNLAGDIYAPKTNLQGKSDKLMKTSTPNSMNYQKNELTGEKPAIQMGTDGNYVNNGVLTDKDKEAGAMQQVSQNFGTQSDTTVNGTDMLDKINAAGNAFAGFMERGEDKRQEAKMAHRLNADNLYATTTATDRGTYDQEGRFKLDEEGFTGVARYGGYMEEGGSYEEGGDTWMSEEQIQKFLAEGGELEFV